MVYAGCIFDVQNAVTGWVEWKPKLVLAIVGLGEVNKSNHLDSDILPGGRTSDDVLFHTKGSIGTDSAQSRYLWRRHDIRLTMEGRVGTATVKLVRLCDSEAKALGPKDW